MIELLNMPLKGLNPAEKYFLLRLVDAYIKVPLVDLSATELAAKFGVGSRVARKVLNEYLFELECIQKVRGDSAPQGSQSVGRPALSYRFNAEKLKSLSLREGKPGASGKHEKLAAEVLFGRGFNKLLIRNRLLLAIMLSYADECGTVRGLGVSDLGALAGMKYDRCKDSLKELRAERFIISQISGATGAKIFGASAGMYLLDLDFCRERANNLVSNSGVNWQNYLVDPSEIEHGQRLVAQIKILLKERESLAVLKDVDGTESRPPGSLAKQRLRVMQRRIDRLVEVICLEAKCEVDEETLATFFSARAGNPEARLLQLKLEQYAAQMFAGDLGSVKLGETLLDDPVFDVILREVLPRSFRNRQGEGDVPSASAYETIAKVVYGFSRSLAESIRTLARSTDPAARVPEKCALVIVPKEEGLKMRRILVAEKL